MIEQFKGGIAVDDRGLVKFVNDFDFKNVKRFYQVENHEKGFIRAWHGHKKEGKYIYVPRGSVMIGVANLDTEEPKSYVLSDQTPRVLYVPPNHANGFMNLTDDAIIIFFSTSTMEETNGDDYRFPWNHFGGEEFWEVERR